MSNKATNLLSRIKQLFEDALPTAYKLADGTDVTISLLDIGGDFTIAGMPAPEGQYTLQDGTGVTVDSTGKITAVADPSQFASTEYTLADGTKISIDKMDVGGTVMQGEAKIANGEYTLADGSKFTTVDGLITVVTPKPAEAAPAAAKMTKEQVQTAYADIATAAPTDQVGKLVTCVSALMEYCFGWQMDDPDFDPAQDAAEAAQDAKQISDAIIVYEQGLAAQTAKFTAQEQKFTKLEAELKGTKELLTKALALMTELAESPAGDPPPGNERKTLFSGMGATKAKGIARYAEAAKTLNDSNK